MLLFSDNNICGICNSHKRDHSGCQIKACKTGYWPNAERIVTEYRDRLICRILFDYKMKRMRKEARIYD